MNSVIIKKNDKFKSMYISFNLLLPLDSTNNSRNALIASVLKQGCEKYETEQKIELELVKNYNSTLNVSIDKIGNVYNIEFAVEVINKKYIEEDVLEKVLTILENVIYYPLLEKGVFKEEYVEREKQVLVNKIEEEKNNKRIYALKRLEEEMFKDFEYGLSVLGTKDLIMKENALTLYDYYLNILSIAEKKIVVVGNTNEYNNIEDLVARYLLKEKASDKLSKLQSFKKENILLEQNTKTTEEFENLNQSVLCMGLGIKNYTKEDFFVASIYNAILGETPSSKLFQNVREKASLAYFAKSQYLRHMGCIYIFSGINLKNFDKAKKIIATQISDMKNNNVTDEEFDTAKRHVIYSYEALEDKKENIAKIELGDELLFDEEKVDLKEKVIKFKSVKKEEVIAFATRVFINNIFLLGGTQDE